MNPVAQIAADLKQVTADDIARASRALDEPTAGETVIASIESPDTLAHWALAHVYLGRARRGENRASFAARTAEEQKAARAAASRWTSMAEVCRNIAWVLIRDEAGREAWESLSVGLRSGFRLVSAPTDEPPSIPRAVLSAAFDALGHAFPVPEPEAKEPPKHGKN